MFISRMPLNTARIGAQRLIGSPYRMHAAVEAAFPPGATRTSEDGRILWRLDALDQERGLWLYVVSPEQPDLTHIIEQAGWPAHMAWESKDYTPLLSRIAVGQRWRFRLKANPVRLAKDDKGKRSRVRSEDIVGKLQGHITVKDQTNWLITRCESHGFTILDDDTGMPSVLVKQRHREQFDRSGRTVTLVTAVFEGHLQVTDAERFRHTLCHGLGRAKGFGCGLLTVAPIMTAVQGDDHD